MQNKLFHRLIATFVLITTVSIPQITFAGACQAQTSTALSNKSNTPHEDECQNDDQQQKKKIERKQPQEDRQSSSNPTNSQSSDEKNCDDGHLVGSKSQIIASSFIEYEFKIMREYPVRLIEPLYELININLPNSGKEVILFARNKIPKSVNKDYLAAFEKSKNILPIIEKSKNILADFEKSKNILPPIEQEILEVSARIFKFI